MECEDEWLCLVARMVKCRTWKQQSKETFRGCLVCVFKQSFSVFKQYFTHFNTLFHPHIFSQILLNNNFQFLNTHTKRVLNYWSWWEALKVFYAWMDCVAVWGRSSAPRMCSHNKKSLFIYDYWYSLLLELARDFVFYAWMDGVAVWGRSSVPRRQKKDYWYSQER